MDSVKRQMLKGSWLGGALFIAPAVAAIVQKGEPGRDGKDGRPGPPGMDGLDGPMGQPQKFVEVELGEHDILVMHTDTPLNSHTCERLKRYLANELQKPGRLCLVMDSGVTYSVIKRTMAKADSLMENK